MFFINEKATANVTNGNVSVISTTYKSEKVELSSPKTRPDHLDGLVLDQ